MTVRRWWNDTDRQTPQYSDRSLSQCHVVPHKPHRDCPVLKPFIRGDRPATDSVNHGSYLYPLFPQTNLLKNTYSTILLLHSSQWPRGLRRGSAAARLLELWVRILAEAWCLSVVSVVCCQVKFSASGWSLIQRSPIERGVSECDRGTSKMRSGPIRNVEPWKKKIISTSLLFSYLFKIL
jgi:hypothetical protein